jgi:drug/metabolite transporter (DMT)-like permease
MKIAAPVAAALGAAALFGASTPVAKTLVGDADPVLVAGLLYLGSGIGLALVRLVRDRGFVAPVLSRRDAGWLLGAIAFGGVAGPALLMLGLARTDAADASLLLNLEAVFTALIAWIIFREHTHGRIMAGMSLIVAGGVVLAWPVGRAAVSEPLGLAAVAAAGLCWAVDNNFTRNVAAGDALFVAGSKGLVAGAFNLALAVALGADLPALSTAAVALLTGFLGYGASLVLFVLALRGLGTARTGAYFSLAPFIGAGLAVTAFGASMTLPLAFAAVLMAAGVALHLTERHEHAHAHEPLEHTHSHVHDEHHCHEHGFAWDGREPHAHPHAHAAIVHAHPHFPDIHHRHEHA